MEADIHDPVALAALLQGADAVVNLVGILKGGEGAPYGAGFARAHVELPRRIAAAARQAGVARLLHVSALKASAAAPSGYLRSKAAGEAALGDEFPAATIFRPSVIFGRCDSFLTLFAQLSQRLPVVPLACPEARFQPVWVGDVAEAMVRALAQRDSAGAAFDLCGPKAYSLRQLVALAGEAAGCRRPIVGLSPALSYLQALVLEFLPGGPMTRDNVRSMKVASVCDAGCVLPFGISPTPIEAIARDYLGRVSR
jgi:NADH dehydrogenase